MLLKWIRHAISCLPNWVWSVPEVVPLSSVHIYLGGRGWWDKGGNFIAFDEGRTLLNLLGCLLSRRFLVHASES